MNKTERLLDGIAIECPDEQTRAVHQYSPRKEWAGYNRNARRERDELAYYAKKRRLIYGAPLTVFIFAMVIFSAGVFSSKQPILATQQVGASSIGSLPNDKSYGSSSDQIPPEDYLDAHKAPLDYPRIVTVNSLGVRARVFEVGRDERAHPQLAKNSYDTGWYNASAKPGDGGAVVLSGACSGSVGHGSFRELGNISIGSSIDIERGDGKIFRYIVQSKEIVAVDKLDIHKLLNSFDSIEQGLNLIGCTGSYDEKTNDFAGRALVYATLDLTK